MSDYLLRRGFQAIGGEVCSAEYTAGELFLSEEVG